MSEKIDKNQINAEIGFRIRKQRESLNLSREKLAEKVNISPQFLSEIENGKKGMSSFTLLKICEGLGVSSDYILVGINMDDYPNIVRILSKLDKEQVKYAENILNVFVVAINNAK